MAERGYTSAPTEGLGGVLVRGKIERLALISLTDIARLNCRGADNEIDGKKTDAARRYVFALAALAEAYPRSTGSHRLRSGCELIGISRTVELRGGDEKYADADKLKALYANRKMLIAVAAEAKTLLVSSENSASRNTGCQLGANSQISGIARLSRTRPDYP